MPVDLSVGDPLLLLLLLFLLPLTLLELGPFDTVTHLVQYFPGVLCLFLKLGK